MACSVFRQGRGRLSIDSLWVAIVLAGFGFLVSLTPLPPNDFWWHLKIGELIATTGHVPTANMFAWSLPADTPFVYAAWLGEWALYMLYRLGGLALVTFSRTVVVLASFWLIAIEAHRRSRSWRIVALALAPACLMSLNNVIIRPQMWSFLPFVSILVLLWRFIDGHLPGRWLLVCPILMVFWVNAHGAFVLGLVLGAAFTAGELLTATGPQHRDDWQQRALWLCVITLLMALATLVNPRGLGIAGYVHKLMTDPPSQGLVVEWQAPAPHGVVNIALYVDVLLILVVFAYARRAPRPADLLLLLGFLWLAWSGQRYMIWFALVSVPILAEAIGGLDVRGLSSVSRRLWLNSALACLLFVPVLVVQPWWVESIPLPETYWDQVYREAEVGPLVRTITPLAAVEYLRQHPGGKLFNEMGYGSYLIWALPEQGVFVDPRVELYPYEQWRDYIRINNGVRYNEILQSYGVDRVLLDVGEQSELANSLKTDPLWRLEYEDIYAQVWARVSDWLDDGS